MKGGTKCVIMLIEFNLFLGVENQIAGSALFGKLQIFFTDFSRRYAGFFRLSEG